MSTFAYNVIKFNKELSFSGKLPDNIKILNPFRDNPEVNTISEAFYHKYYSDNKQRKIILGINPGRFGAGVTGVPFTDSKRLSEICGIHIESVSTHEPSSVFIYDVIDKYGGPEKFYGDYHIGSVCPLGFVIKNNKGNWVNCNYYDYHELLFAVKDFIIESLKKQISFNVDKEKCFVLGKKNGIFFKKINEKEQLFKSVVVLEHPRYIVQYKSKEKEIYISNYLEKLCI